MEKLQGIKGWLLLYTVLLVLVIIMAAEVIAFQGWVFFGLDLKGQMFIYFQIITLALYCISLFAILNKLKNAPKWTIISLWFGSIAAIAISIGLPLIYETEIGSMETVRTLLLSITAPIIWTLYFLKSKRVKNTFIR